MAQTVHVQPDPGGGWLVKPAGSARDAGHYQSHGQAVNIGRDLARELKANLVLHAADGSESMEKYPYFGH